MGDRPTTIERPGWWDWSQEFGGTGKPDGLGRLIAPADHWWEFDWPPGWFPQRPKCLRCGDVGRWQTYRDDGVPLMNAPCLDCERGRFLSAAWYYEKHGYAPPPYTADDFAPDPADFWPDDLDAAASGEEGSDGG